MYHGDADRLTSYDASKKFADAHTDSVTFLSVENGYHEIHQDAMAEEVLASVIDWMQSKLQLIDYPFKDFEAEVRQGWLPFDVL